MDRNIGAVETYIRVFGLVETEGSTCFLVFCVSDVLVATVSEKLTTQMIILTMSLKLALTTIKESEPIVQVLLNKAREHSSVCHVVRLGSKLGSA